MIDRRVRDELAELLLQFRNGEINGTSLLLSWPKSEDAAIRGMSGKYHLTLGASHISNNPKRLDMRVTELRDCKSMIKELDRAVLFLRTDQEYRWREYPLLGDPTLLPFQMLAFLITMPFFALGFMWLDDRSVNPILTTCLMISALTAGTLVGGALLRSIFTGIDYRFWPFYRWTDYWKAKRSMNR